ncbi:hypothetical protein C8R44DRAFT_176856 [Mycena epipterygia]|nr:hypothetical protein C8R44DRAFT_176856 [Mycena epipterygia]
MIGLGMYSMACVRRFCGLLINPVGPALASLESNDSVRPQNISEEQPPVPPRREYVWRTTDRGQQSLATIANRITLDLDMKLSSLRRLPWSDGQRSHRCAGYVREEITLAITTVDSAVVLRDAPSPLEICSVCHEIVGFDEAFHCVCGDFNPGSRHTVKCQLCKFWSHSDCVGNPKEFRCTRCPPGVTPFIPPLPSPGVTPFIPPLPSPGVTPFIPPLPSPELHSPSFGPYSPRYDASLGPIENMLVGDSTSAGLLSDQAEVPHTDTSSQLEPLSMFDFLDSNVNEGSAVISDTDSALVPTSPFIEPTRLVPGPENPGLFDPRSPREMSWATWQPDPASVPTSPFIEPTRLVPDPESPGLFGPRSPREIRKMPSWETWQPDPTSVPTPPSTEVRLVVPSMFGPRSPGESPYDSIKNLPMEDDSTSAGLFSDQAEVPANSSELEPLSGFDFLDNKMDEGPPDAA